MNATKLTRTPADAQGERPTVPIAEDVRLFQYANVPTASGFLRYFWHTLGELDQCLTPLHAFFGDRWTRPISPADMNAYVATRQAQGITDRAIHQELSHLDAMIQHANKHRGRGCPSLPSRKFLKRPPQADTAQGNVKQQA